MPELTEHLLVAIVALPAAGGLALALLGLLLGFIGLPPLPERVWLGLGLAISFATFALAVALITLGFDPEVIGLQQVERVGWSDALGAHLLFGIDGIGLFFVLSTTGIVPLAMLASRFEIRDSVRSWIFVVLFLETCLLGALTAANLLTFVFFWALVSLPIVLWMARWGGLGRARAAARIWTTEAIGLAGLLFSVFVVRGAALEQTGAASLDLVWTGSGTGPTLLDVEIAAADQTLLFLAMALGLATRLPIVPLHFWLPAAHATSPTGLSVLLATGFVQTAAIGLLRFALPLFPNAASELGPALAVLGILALVYASLVALVQKELKRLVAYASVGYAGFALFGISTLNVQGLTGAVLQLLTHGLATAGLFTLIGFLAARRGTTEVAAFGGLAKPMPVCAFFFGVMVLSLMGLPLLGGFVGDLFVLLGSLETRRELSFAALLALVVAASYLLWVQRRLFLGPVDEPANRGLIDLDRVERAILLAMTIPVVLIGVYPNPVLRRIEPAVLEILHQMESRKTIELEADPESESEPAVAQASAERLRRGVVEP